MVQRHGARSTYRNGCRCSECHGAERRYQADYARRKREGGPIWAAPPTEAVRAIPPATPESDDAGPGPVEQGVLSEVAGSASASARPGLVEAALALARILDNRRVVSPQPAAASKLQSILGELRQGGDGESRCSRLAAVRSMTSADGKSAAG